jgi:uncharacterized protein (DUF1015 family)
MTKAVPFTGIIFNSSKLSGDEVIAPPYDVINAEMREALYSKSPHNIIKIDAALDMPGDDDTENKYTRAAAFLKAWLADGALIREESPVYYACSIEYSVAGEKKSLTGLFSDVRLVELGKGVFPHEATHSKPKKDRLALMNHTGANTSPVYSLYSGAKASVGEILDIAVTGTEPDLEFKDPDGTLHRFWPVRDASTISFIEDALSDISVFIADGHHRYETALEYQRVRREEDGNPEADQPYDYILMFLVDVNDPGLTVLPTHRLVTVDVEGMREKLEEHFDVRELAEGVDVLGAIEGRDRTFGLYDGQKNFIVACKGDCPMGEVDAVLGKLDVVLLHKLIFGKLLELGGWSYEMDVDTARGMVDEGEYDAAFFLNSTRVSDVEQVALKALRMPPKSTYFYPKVQTGFVINDLKTF